MSDTLIRNLRHALRLLAKSPGFTSIAILTLALGIGANTVIFTVADALFLRPLPYPEPERVVLVSASNPSQGTVVGSLSYPRYKFLREHARSFQGIAAAVNDTFSLTDSGEPEQIAAARVSAEFFDVLGVRPVIGRSFLPDEDQPGGKDVVLLSHSLWIKRFGGSSGVLGRSLTLDTRRYTVIGVMPPGFAFDLLGSTVDLWAPRVFELNLATAAQVNAGAQFLSAVARLRAGIGMERAQAEMDVLNQEYLREYPKIADANPHVLIVVANLKEQLVADVRRALLLLTGAVGLLLLIACSNLASLLLSRALGRKKETAVRMALGASRGALMAQLLTESVLLALMGGTLGVLLSVAGTRVLGTLAQASLPRVQEIRMDAMVLGYSLLISLLSGLLFGLAPALQSSRADVNDGLREESRGAFGSQSRHRFRSALVMAQVALSMVLLIGAGLLIRSFVHLQDVKPGFSAENLLTLNISLPPARYQTNAQMVNFFEALAKETAAVPGVRAAAVASALPVNPSRFSPALLEGQPPLPLPQRPVMVIQTITPDYFTALRTPLLRGRAFTEHDDAAAAQVGMVNQTLAQRYWPGANPIGKKIWIGRLVAPIEVVGVAGDIKNITLAGDASPEIYLPFSQRPWRKMNLLVRTTGDPHTMISAARHQVTLLDKGQAVTAVQTMNDVLVGARAQPRLFVLLLGVFSAAAVLLAAIGLYGTVSYSVTQRSQELGLRIALGASPGQILGLVIYQGMALTWSGVAMGVLVSIALTRVMSSLLYHVSATDPITFVGSALVFGCITFVAAYAPARRATQVDPIVATRGGS